MEDYQDSSSSTSSPKKNNTPERNEGVRSRWNPKPEQILILESIFNSGMVNPPKEETVRIRKLLEKFGAVGDANVFYWFQNRRSRSRRRQRQLQLQATLGPPPATADHPQHAGAAAGVVISSCVFPPSSSASNSAVSSYFPNLLGSSSSSSSPCCGGVDDEMLCLSGGEAMMSMNSAGIEPAGSSITPSSLMSSHDASHLQYHQPGLITVFINGVATEVPRGPIDMKAMFGGGEDELLLYHSSGIPLPINQFGILLQTLRHGESYFLVSRTA